MRKIGAVAGLVIVLGLVSWLAGVPVDGPPAVASTLSVEEASYGSMTPQEHAYVGAREGCRKCHLKQYRSWEDTPHATALDTLEAEGEAGNSECVRCHVTGYGTATGFQSRETTPELAAVTCEACHGPGGDYRDREIMKDLEAAMAVGLNIPDEQTCLACHNDQSPTFPGEFNFEEMVIKGVHEIES